MLSGCTVQYGHKDLTLVLSLSVHVFLFPLLVMCVWINEWRRMDE